MKKGFIGPSNEFCCPMGEISGLCKFFVILNKIYTDLALSPVTKKCRNQLYPGRPAFIMISFYDDLKFDVEKD